ncbi:hypothetical protein SAPIO_CDS5073 [Scedosporium apiospermum]|uniref:LIM zinc-binding domain-containing protein n=1 Tax=Pseudallescheria apiosperma TaxID=563466 RepID=A0A084G761_PSEDA|nr:uncharacterized protein SAPIO_CDS5073 [Scedosporium apiospermum]KEZ43173.1 hypothetical protein SAPIO_CDS5073 [Scedosporium apiospermum]
MERGHRWMEKEEACSLRQAMEDMELKDQNLSKASSPSDDQRIYEAALNEASELVWQHQHPGASNPTGPYRYRPHLRKNSYAHARTASVGMYGDEIVATGLARDTPRSVSGSSAESAASLPLTKQRNPNAGIPEGIAPARRDGHLGQGSHRSGSKRNISGEIGNPFSVDQIWEEPEAVVKAMVPGHSPLQELPQEGLGALGRRSPKAKALPCATNAGIISKAEPDSFRRERLERINRRMAGEILEEAPGKTMAEDGDDRLRFYCHLDWHELFAPKCKHCKTPILGEHIVALGEHWHYGHFFCAECGDPFEHGMTHIEKDGYAWCISCQTKRTERRAPKCRKCKLAVVGQYVQALGKELAEKIYGIWGIRRLNPLALEEKTDGSHVLALPIAERAHELL